MSDLKGLELNLPPPFYQSVLNDRDLYINYFNQFGRVKLDAKIDNFLKIIQEIFLHNIHLFYLTSWKLGTQLLEQ